MQFQNITVSRYDADCADAGSATLFGSLTVRRSRLTDLIAIAAIAAVSLLSAARPAAAQTMEEQVVRAGQPPVALPSLPIGPNGEINIPKADPGPFNLSPANSPKWIDDTEVRHDIGSGKTFTGTPQQPRMQSLLESIVEGDLFSGGTAGRNRSLIPERLLGGPARTQEPGMMHGNQVFGSDDRIRINPTNYFPASAQCHLVMQFPNGDWRQGSGTLIGYKYVLTAGHCVFDRGRGGWARVVYVYPGQNGGALPYGSAYATYLRSVTGWTNSGYTDYDYGLVTLSRNIGSTTGWFGYASFSDSTLDNTSTCYITGYPAEKAYGTQWQGWGGLSDYSSTFLYYRVDMTPGDSGAGVYRFYNNYRYVFGVNAYENVWHFDWFNTGYYNGGPKINSGRFSQIQGWIASGY